MFIPKFILSAFSIASKIPTRYAINGVKFSRLKGGAMQAEATNGWCGLTVTWKAESLKGWTMSTEPKEGFSAILPASVKRFANGREVLLQEGEDATRATMEIREFDGNTAIGIALPKGNFPPMHEVYPKYELQGDKPTAIRYGVTAKLLLDLITAARNVCPHGCAKDYLELIVPMDSTKPMMLTRSNSEGVEAKGVLMPCAKPV